MTNIYSAFLLTLIAGLSTLIGYFFIYLKTSLNNIISKSLGLATGVMITVSIIELIPNSYNMLINKFNTILTVFLIIMGILLGYSFSSIINQTIEKKSNIDLKLYKIGLMSLLVLVLHNIPEGIITFITAANDFKLGIALSIAISLHNIPEGIAISIPIYCSTKDKFKTFTYVLISSLSELFGAIITYLFLYKYINIKILGIIYSIIAGMMINISINELFIEAKKHNKYYSIVYLIIGITIMIISHLIIK